MSSLSNILRVACDANGLGTSGTSAILLKRLVSAGKRAPKSKAPKPRATTTSKASNVCKGGVCKPKSTTPIKVTGNGARMSASYYFHEVCAGKITRCKPQVIQEPSGRHRLKEIKIVKGATGKHPRWVLVNRAPW